VNLYKLSTALFRKPSTSWPSPTQELLIQAAVLEGTDSFQAWTEWRERIAWEQVDDKSRQLFPLVYRKLKEHDIDPAKIKPLKTEYQKVRLKNSLLFQAVHNPIEALVKAAIPTMLLKGAALTLNYYKDPSLRPMDDVDILVPPEAVRTALEVLEEYGWTPDDELSGPHADTFMYYSASIGLKNPADFAFDINWHLINLNCARDADREYWNKAEPVEFNGIPLLSLNPGHQLLHVCVHGMTHIPMSLKWIPDASLILNRAGPEIEWDRLLVFLQAQNLILPVKDTLFYLHNLLDVPVPEDVLAGFESYKGTVYEQREYYALTGRYIESGSLPLLWVLYHRHTRDQQQRGGHTLSFIQYLQAGWGLDKSLEVPFRFLRLVIARIWKVFSGFLLRS
jgi:hypothetical protein